MKVLLLRLIHVQVKERRHRGFLHPSVSLSASFDTCPSEKREVKGFLFASVSLAASFDTCKSGRKEE